MGSIKRARLSEQRRLWWCRVVAYGVPVVAGVVTYAVQSLYAAYGPAGPVAGTRRGDGIVEGAVLVLNAVVAAGVVFGGVFRLHPLPTGRVQAALTSGVVAMSLSVVAWVGVTMAIDLLPGVVWRMMR